MPKIAGNPPKSNQFPKTISKQNKTGLRNPLNRPQKPRGA